MFAYLYLCTLLFLYMYHFINVRFYINYVYMYKALLKKVAFVRQSKNLSFSKVPYIIYMYIIFC